VRTRRFRVPRRALIIGVAGLLLVLAGTWWLTAHRLVDGPPRSPDAPATAAPSASGSPTAFPDPYVAPSPSVAIPDGVMLTAGDLDRRAVVADSDPARWTRGLALFPRPCDEAGFASTTLRTAHRAALASIDTKGDGLEGDRVVHYVATYAGTGAPQFLTELRAAVDCWGGSGWDRTGEVGVGEESVLLRLDMVGGFAGQKEIPRFLTVVRIGRAVSVVSSIGTFDVAGDEQRALTAARLVAARLGPIA
jgi:hypothetical protein